MEVLIMDRGESFIHDRKLFTLSEIEGKFYYQEGYNHIESCSIKVYDCVIDAFKDIKNYIHHRTTHISGKMFSLLREELIKDGVFKTMTFGKYKYTTFHQLEGLIELVKEITIEELGKYNDDPIEDLVIEPTMMYVLKDGTICFISDTSYRVKKHTESDQNEVDIPFERLNDEQKRIVEFIKDQLEEREDASLEFYVDEDWDEILADDYEELLRWFCMNKNFSDDKIYLI